MILGIHDGHNASASLIDSNGIKYAISEERFTRKKNQRGFPKNSIEYILNSLENTGSNENSNIDLITVGGVFRKGGRLKDLKRFQEKIQVPMLYFNHHLCHASLYQLSEFKECLSITIDGGGDGFSSTVSIGTKKGLEIIAQSDLIDSVGDFYASITELLGFKPMEDEGKVMSLSGYDCEGVTYDYDLKILDYNEKTKSFKNYLGTVGYEATKALKRIFNYSGSWDEKVSISKFAQKTLEDTVLKLIKSLVHETGIENIVFSGGVAQNVKLNKVIRENVGEIFIPPFMGDEGLSIGSSLLLDNAKFNKSNIILKDTYLGYEIKNEDITINSTGLNNNLNYKITYLEEEEIPEVVGDLITSNKIVCVCRGRMEFGPRALGNRSILALPTKENAIKIGKMLKRDLFMPFAPTILYDYVNDYLENPSYSPFMTMLFDVKENKEKMSNINDISGVVHKDNTTRPQTLKKDFNSTYYGVISHVYESKDIPMVLNTSFNLHGEPIVCNEKDAIRSFKKVGDALLLGNYLIEKN
ncbi:MAG: carbamoyltransferase [Methanothermococcus sp.]|jgi:carbamoyltransferase|uniref:carbamoyltransferase C-terminal domain-containing protein n=1 Tax=Methanothermococcus TaxID=155862 RepID=UPI00037ADDF3|nr:MULTISPECIES: carbamoyltransferase C-terminal domain-containing protein [Methanothermococcus]MDK2790160.1 carbamoyltransferase [Methanothermococcus sp.]MDK2987036.1 carbamoyltransferase [Methanothermococcus sp.]